MYFTLSYIYFRQNSILGLCITARYAIYKIYTWLRKNTFLVTNNNEYRLVVQKGVGAQTTFVIMEF